MRYTSILRNKLPPMAPQLKPELNLMSKVFHTADKKNFHPQTAMKKINIQGVTAARVLHGNLHALGLNSAHVATDDHPMAIIARYKCALREKEPLWWHVLSTKAIGVRVIRAWHVNRLRVAFKDALKRKGFDQVGRKISGPGATNSESDLWGTIHFMILEDIKTTSWTVLNTQADKVVEFLEQKSRIQLEASPKQKLSYRSRTNDSYNRKNK